MTESPSTSDSTDEHQLLALLDQAIDDAIRDPKGFQMSPELVYMLSKVGIAPTWEIAHQIKRAAFRRLIAAPSPTLPRQYPVTRATVVPPGRPSHNR